MHPCHSSPQITTRATRADDGVAAQQRRVHPMKLPVVAIARHVFPLFLLGAAFGKAKHTQSYFDILMAATLVVLVALGSIFGAF